MPFEKLEYKRLWTVDDDGEKGFPTYQDSEQKVREDLQYHPDAIRDFINNRLLAALEAASAAGSIGCMWKDGEAEMTGSVAAAVADLYGVKLPYLQKQIMDMTFGGAPDSVLSAEVRFTAGDWAAGGSAYTQTIPLAQHKRTGPAFGYQIWAESGGAYRSDTWYGAGTTVEYVNGDIVLTAEEPYTGRIVFFGI